VPPPTRDTRKFVQRRAQNTVKRLLSAAGQVFSEKGFDEAQSPEIAERAGVSVGTFYRYFADKRQAFIELITQYLEESYASVMGNLTLEIFGETSTPRQRREAVNHVIDLLFAQTAKNPRLQRVFLALSLRDPQIEQIRIDFETRSRDNLAALLEIVTDRDRIPNPSAAAQVIQVAAQEVALTTIGAHGRVSSQAEADALRSALADMLYTYVFGEAVE
jgi:AcrR family transcriptional regulator